MCLALLSLNTSALSYQSWNNFFWDSIEIIRKASVISPEKWIKCRRCFYAFGAVHFCFLQIFEQVLSELEPLCLAEQDFISKFFKLQQHQSMPGTMVWLTFICWLIFMISSIISLVNLLSQFQHQNRKRKNLQCKDFFSIFCHITK